MPRNPSRDQPATLARRRASPSAVMIAIIGVGIAVAFVVFSILMPILEMNEWIT